MEDIHPHPRANTHYRLMEDDSPTFTVAKNRHISFKITTKKIEEEYYSASNEESIDFAEDESPVHSPLHKKFAARDQGSRPLTLDKTWKNELPSITDDKFDEEAFTSTSSKHQVKFVNGLPTVVKKHTSQKFHCLQCHYEGYTKLEHKIGKSLKIIMIVFLFILFWPCLAYLAWSNEWKDIVHSCPNCGYTVGKRRVTHERFH